VNKAAVLGKFRDYASQGACQEFAVHTAIHCSLGCKPNAASSSDDNRMMLILHTMQLYSVMRVMEELTAGGASSMYNPSAEERI
jgi:hypothetical protein